MNAGLGIEDQPCIVIVLAAGEGKRMRSTLPKVLHPLLGRTLIGHVLAAASGALPAARTVVVVGKGADLVGELVANVEPEAITALQAEQHGTGHAVRVGLEAVSNATGPVVVLNGDIPLLRAETLREMVSAHLAGRAAATVLTAQVPEPAGLGRVLRTMEGDFAGIVEERDATPEQRAIAEINAGAYVFDGDLLVQSLSKLTRDNDQGEEYITDVLGLLLGAGRRVLAHRSADPNEALGANDRSELATLRALLRDRVNLQLMLDGVTIVDPRSTWIDVTATVGRDAVIEPNTHLRGETAVAEGAVVGPDTTLIDCAVGEGASVIRSHAVGARVGEGATVGPFAYLRPGARLEREAKVGTFVEVKNSDLGAGAKVPHLTYVGDASIGEGTNIGAATVFANYDGVRKFRTTVGAHARTGADNMFVAPVSIGDGAYTAAGSVITEDVPAGALGIARGRQRNIPGWVERNRAGTAAAEAAHRALGESAPGDEAGKAGDDDGSGPAATPPERGRR